MLSLRSVISVLISSLLLSLSTVGLFADSPGISYFSGDLENLRQEAAQKNLPYVIYFSLPDQLECQQLESQTFTYDPLVKYVSSRFLIYHVNAMDGIYAQALVQHYQVKGFPTMLIFGSTGKNWGQIFGYVSGLDLHQEMQRLFGEHEIPIPIPQWRDGESTAVESGNLLTEGIESAPMAFSVLVQYDPVGRMEDENFGIKVGRFTNINHLEWEVQKYERFWQGAIFAYKEVIRGRDYYMLILGGYESPEEADAYATPMQQIAAIDTEVIDLRKLIAGL
jgi:thioredoxin-related protein